MKLNLSSLMFFPLSASLVCAATASNARSETRAVEISCSDFRRNPDGTWSPIRNTVVVGPRGPFRLLAGEVFHIQLQGATNYGVNVAEILNERCR